MLVTPSCWTCCKCKPSSSATGTEIEDMALKTCEDSGAQRQLKFWHSHNVQEGLRTLVIGRSVPAAGMAARMAGERSAVLTDARFRPGTGSARRTDGAACTVRLFDGCKCSMSVQAMAASTRHHQSLVRGSKCSWSAV